MRTHTLLAQRRFGCRSAASALVLAVAFCALTAGSVDAVPTTALTVQVATQARAVHGSDGRVHVDYDLISTNGFTAPVTLDSIEVRDGKRWC
jgi:hypothetical protein